MTEIGYFLSSEEHGPAELVHQAQMASDVGIESIWISDHFHPWLDEQGASPFVWSVIGAIAATTPLAVMTAVTCPTMRIHPAIVAQAAATSALLLEGRFELGVGTGENLNEHILGQRWPPTDVRLDMLAEAVEVMRRLWSGDEVTHRGPHFTVENGRLYSVPETPPNVMMSAFGPQAARRAAEIADGFVSTKPDRALLDVYRSGGGKGVAAAGVKVCWGPDRDECARLAHHRWRTSGVPGELSQELRTPALFDQASTLVTVDEVAEKTPCGPDVEPIVEAVRTYIDAGFDRVFLNQIGPNQADFFRFYNHELAGALAELGAAPTRRCAVSPPVRPGHGA
jgi:G6PDH family F420-dependent oxidoreductase